ncbi:flagellar motor protein MotB [Clostridium uliginosum]|uniref:Chemotaxis protein MotB n=1 Tax=Clostridium uliginosum TaxID=119641 RepID=A0A1I1KRS7_9CLOT|nr:flagellar motor protein MotB [Clostridium uliginosum]SFC61398.1 chemotaxis protein MotB [Clostridium uliginosum]
MARRKKSDDSGGLRGDEWLGTYSDCVTLLLTFFILLYAMSSVDAQKVQSISQAFVTVMSGKSGDTFLEYNMYNGKVPIIGGESDVQGMVDSGALGKGSMYQEIKDFVEKNELTGAMDIKNDRRGIILELKDNVLFESGKANLIPGSKEILEKVNALMESLPNLVTIEGHTDNVPISNSKYASNWELSTERAVTVVRYFVEEKKQDPLKFSAAGYGEFRPVEENNSEENKAKNRRVNILIEASNNKE